MQHMIGPLPQQLQPVSGGEVLVNLSSAAKMSPKLSKVCLHYTPVMSDKKTET